MTNRITAILTAYRRPHTLAPLIEAVRGQSVPPSLVWAWANDPSEELSSRLRLAGLDRVVASSQNAYFHGRFALALLAPTEFVALFDDDSIPGCDWFKSCLEAMARTPGILGTAGLVLHGPSYAHRTMYGWQRPNDEAVEVDLVGQTWFLRTEWVRYLFADRPITLTNGEDIELAARAWRMARIRSYCPPHPPRDLRRWGSTRGMELGIDAVATSLRCSHEAERDAIVKTEISAGWLPLFARVASVGNALSGDLRSGIRGNAEDSPIRPPVTDFARLQGNGIRETDGYAPGGRPAQAVCPDGVTSTPDHVPFAYGKIRGTTQGARP